MMSTKIVLLTIVTFMLSNEACGNMDADSNLRYRTVGPTVTITNPEIQGELSSALTLVQVRATPSPGWNYITRVELHLNGKLACYEASGNLQVVRFGPYDNSCGPMMVLGNGDHKIMAKAWDSAGEWASTTMGITINAGSCQPTGLYSDINHMWLHYVQEDLRKLAIREYEWKESPYKSRLDYYSTDDDQNLNWFVIKLNEGDNAYNTKARSPRLEIYNNQYRYPMDPGSGIWEFSANIAGYQLCGDNCGNHIMIFQIFSRFEAWTVSMFVRRSAAEGVQFKDRGGKRVKIAEHGETFHFKISVNWDTNTYSIFVNCQAVTDWQNKPLWNPQYGGYIFRFGAYGQTTSQMLAPARIHYSGVKMINYDIKPPGLESLGGLPLAIRPPPHHHHHPPVNNQTQSIVLVKKESKPSMSFFPPAGGPAVGGGFVRDTSNRVSVRLHTELKLIFDESQEGATTTTTTTTLGDDVLNEAAAITVLQEMTSSYFNHLFSTTNDSAFAGTTNARFSTENLQVDTTSEFPIKFTSHVEMDNNTNRSTTTSLSKDDIQRLMTNGPLLNQYLIQLKKQQTSSSSNNAYFRYVEKVVVRVIRRGGGGQ